MTENLSDKIRSKDLLTSAYDKFTEKEMIELFKQYYLDLSKNIKMKKGEFKEELFAKNANKTEVIDISTYLQSQVFDYGIKFQEVAESILAKVSGEKHANLLEFYNILTKAITMRKRVFQEIATRQRKYFESKGRLKPLDIYHTDISKKLGFRRHGLENYVGRVEFKIGNRKVPAKLFVSGRQNTIKALGGVIRMITKRKQLQNKALSVHHDRNSHY